MKANLIAKEKGDAKITIAFTSEEFEQAQIDTYKKEKDKYEVDGFRKGKAPRSIIEKRYGETVFFDGAINSLFEDAYPKAIEELGLEVIDYPRIDMEKVEKGKPLTANVTVAIFPELDVKNYTDVKIENIEAKVSEEDVNSSIGEMQKRNARMIDVQREVKEGDHIILDYRGFVGDEQFPGGTAENHSLIIGSGSFIPGFEEQLVGAKKEEEVEVRVTFPEEYHSKELSGKDALFKCTVHEIKEEELPELDDEFAKDVSEFDTFEELKRDVEKKLLEAKEEMVKNQMKDKVIEKVYESNEFEAPNIMIEEEITSMMREMDMQLQQQGMQLGQYLQMMGKEVGDFRGELKEDAERRVKTRIILKGIADAEKLEISDEDIDGEVEKMAQMHKMEKEKLIEMMGKDNLKNLGKDLLMNKAINFMFEKAVIE